MNDKPIFDKVFRQRRYDNAHFNFTNLFMWRKAYNIEWTEIDAFLCIKASWEDEHFILPPFGLPDEKIAGVLDKLEDYFAQKNWEFSIRGATQDLLTAIEQQRPGKYKIEDDRDNFDYVYNSSDLIELKGRKYHSKKNHINSFKRTYHSYQYAQLCSELVKSCIATELEWCSKRNCEQDPMLLLEKAAIIDALENFEYLGLTGGAIIIEDKVEAFTFGEPLNEDTAVIHVEKGNPDIRGIYPTINWEFCRNNWSNMQFINREEDMGIEGLKQAKESYYPVKMVEKFILTLK